jgi:hypothetical protein
MEENTQEFRGRPLRGRGGHQAADHRLTETAKALLALMWNGNKSGMGAPKILVFRAFEGGTSGISAVVIENPKD